MGRESPHEKQITKDQHFVPRFYLKRFAKEGQIQVLDVQAKRIGNPRPYGSVCYEKFFYAAKTGVQDEISQILELMLGRIESKIADALPGVIERADRQLTSSDLDVLANLMSLQWVRTPHFREQVQTIESPATKLILKKLASLGALRSAAQDMGMSDEGIVERLEQNILSDRYNIRITTNAFSLLFVKDIPEFSGLLLAKKWRIVLSEEPYRFITSDNPVAEWRVTPNTGFMERKHYLSLTPSILIETTRPDSIDPEQQPVERLSYHVANGKEVLMFNRVLADHAHQFAYASQTEHFEQLLRTI